MSSVPSGHDSERGLLEAYSINSDEEMVEAVVNAFQAANIDVFEKSTTLADWIDPDVFEVIQWTVDSPVYLSTWIWDRRVTISPENVRIYAMSDRIPESSVQM